MPTDSESMSADLDSETSTPSTRGGFKLRGPEGLNFGQDVFSQLALLEERHTKFNEDTASERRKMQKFWKSRNDLERDSQHTAAEEKPGETSGPGDNSHSATAATTVTSNDEFRRPALPPPPGRKRRGGIPFEYRRPVARWTRYSLEGVGETDEAGNRAAAISFLQEARDRREATEVGESEMGGEEEGRIVFKCRQDRHTLSARRNDKSNRQQHQKEEDHDETQQQPPRKLARLNPALITGEGEEEMECMESSTDGEPLEHSSSSLPPAVVFSKKSSSQPSSSTRRGNIRRRRKSDSDDSDEG